MEDSSNSDFGKKRCQLFVDDYLNNGVIVLAVLLLSIFSTAMSSNRMMMYSIILTFLSSTFLIHLYICEFKLEIPEKKSFMLIVSFFMILGYSTVASNSPENIFLVLALFYALLITIYIVPSYSTFDQFLHYTAILAAIIGTLGAISIVIGEFSIGMLSVEHHDGAPKTIVGIGETAPRPKSIFGNPNGLGHLTGAGALASFLLLYKYKSPIYAIVLISTICIVYLTGSRGGQLIFILGIITFISVYIFSFLNFDAASPMICNAVFGVILLAVITVLAPTLNILQVLPVDFTNRLLLWDATAQVIRSNLGIGIGYTTENTVLNPYLPDRFQGFSPHNSYLRVFLHAGVLGGFFYIAIQYSIVHDISQLTCEPSKLLIFSFLLPLVFVQLFETFSIFGFSHQSIIIALALGYAVQHITISVDERLDQSHNV